MGSDHTVKRSETLNVAGIAEIIRKEKPETFFTESELTHYFNGKSYARLAVRYIAKTIILEQLAQGMNYHDISIGNDEFGRPVATYTGLIAAAIEAEKGLKRIHISLSHSRLSASAFVIFEYFYPHNSSEKQQG